MFLLNLKTVIEVLLSFFRKKAVTVFSVLAGFVLFVLERFMKENMLPKTGKT